WHGYLSGPGYEHLTEPGLEVALEAARVGGRRRVGEFGQRPHLVRQRVEEEFYDADRRLIVEDGDQDDLARRCRERREEELPVPALVVHVPPAGFPHQSGQCTRRRIRRGRQRGHVRHLVAAGETLLCHDLAAGVHDQRDPHAGIAHETADRFRQRRTEPGDLVASHRTASASLRTSSRTSPSCAVGSARATTMTSLPCAIRMCPCSATSWSARTWPSPASRAERSVRR